MKAHDYCVILGCPRSGTTFLGHALRDLIVNENLRELALPDDAGI